MAKKKDFPKELHRFVEVINSFHGYHHDYDIFRDFIDLITAGTLWNGDPELAQNCKDRYKDDFDKFQDMFRAYIFTLRDNLHPTHDYVGWYDPLGELYQAISSSSHCSWLGQFFTPAPICDMMTRITLGNYNMHIHHVKMKTVNDPACGSGRMLLAFNSWAPGNYLIGQDVDPICTKMTAINMAYHGIFGQAINGDSLMMTYKFGYAILFGRNRVK
jgi:type I restriction enzyme M protein